MKIRNRYTDNIYRLKSVSGTLMADRVDTVKKTNVMIDT